MNVEIMALCEAGTYKNGQTCILHTFENVTIKADVPTPAPMSHVAVAKVRFFANEEGTHVWRLELHDADGAEVWTSGAEAFIVEIKAGVESYAYAIVSPFMAQVSPGEYALRLFIDAEQRQSIPLYVAKAAA